jgi:acetylornithine/N-succinyldiaminopimelate aminotransferase
MSLDISAKNLEKSAPDRSVLMPITRRPDLVMVQGAGSFVWDDSGRRYLDFVQGWAVNALGHCAPEVQTALSAQAGMLMTASPAYDNPNELSLARRLVDLTGLAQVHFASSGAEANEVALKVARKWGRIERGGAFDVVTTHDAFHGRTLAAMAASGKAGWDALFPPNLPGFRRVPHGDIEAMRAAVDERVAAILVEPIQGEAGVVTAPDGYLRELRELADERRVLLIFDEIQTGIGRTGTLFAFESEDARPDVLTLGKGLGSGVPLSAALVSDRAACLGLGDQGGTYHGNPLMTAVGLAVLDAVSRPEFLAGVRARGAELGAGLAALARGSGGKVRGRGLLWALELESPVAEQVRDVCLERGLLVNAARPTILRFMPSLRVTSAEIESMLAVLASALGPLP